MADRDPHNHPHFIFRNSAHSEQFTSPSRGGGGSPIPSRDRSEHGGALLAKLQQLTPVLNDATAQQRQAGVEQGFGLQIEFESLPITGVVENTTCAGAVQSARLVAVPSTCSFELV